MVSKFEFRKISLDKSFKNLRRILKTYWKPYCDLPLERIYSIKQTENKSSVWRVLGCKNFWWSHNWNKRRWSFANLLTQPSFRSSRVTNLRKYWDKLTEVQIDLQRIRQERRSVNSNKFSDYCNTPIQRILRKYRLGTSRRTVSDTSWEDCCTFME